MGKNPVTVGDDVIIQHEGLQQILDALNDEGYETIGPRVRNDTVIYDNLKNIEDLPVGRVDVQGPGGYRLEKSDVPTLFGFVVGPHSLKNYLHPPLIRLWRAQATDDGFQVVDTEEAPPKYAFIGARSCELSALAVHDKVFNTDRFSDPLYNSRREQAFIVAVNCVRPGGTCFCDSMNTGPKVQSGFDIALTEVLDNGRHFFLAEAGSSKGAAILDGVAHRTAGKEETDLARSLLEQASANMGRVLDNSNIKALFYENFEHNRWAKVAERCLTCGNCTLVCPTCFCSTIEDEGSLNGAYAERWRKWDSCFTTEFSYMHGGSARASERSRFRQWLTHKLATWWDQFGTSGCVGCGRCITWCPVGIDITEEKKAILG